MTMWAGNIPGRDDPMILSGSVIDPDAPAGIIDGNTIGATTVLIEGNVISAADLTAILNGDPPPGTKAYILGGNLIP